MAPETAQNAPRKTLIKKITHTARYFLEVDETWSLVKFSRGSCKMRFWKVDKSHPTTQNAQVLSPERAPMRGPPLISQPFLLIPNKHYCTLFYNEFYTTKPGLKPDTDGVVGSTMLGSLRRRNAVQVTGLGRKKRGRPWAKQYLVEPDGTLF